jgi:hypothetical protein
MRSLIPLLFLTLACTSGPMLTRLDYEKVEVGSSISTVVAAHGNPEEVRVHGDGRKEYVYIDRIQVTSRITEFVYYLFSVEGGTIRDKEIRRNEPLPVTGLLPNAL